MFHRRKHPRAVYGVSKLSLLEAAHATCRDAYRQWSASPKDGDVAAELRRLKEEVATMSHTVYQVWLQVHHTEVAIADVLQNVPLAGTFAEPVDEEEPARQRRRHAAPPPAESRAAKARWAAKKISAEARQRLLKQLRGVRHTARRKFYNQLQFDATPAAPRPPRRLPERRPPAADLESPTARMMTLRTMGHSSSGGSGYAPAAAPPPPSPTPADAANPSPSTAPAPPAPTGRTLRGAGAPAASPAAASSSAPPPSPSPPSRAAVAPAPRPAPPAGQPPPSGAAPPTPSAPAVVAPPSEPAPARPPPPPPQPVEDGPEFFLDTRPMTEETSRAPVLRSPVAPQPFIALTGTWTTSPMIAKTREADTAPEAPAPPAPPSILPFTAPTSISCGPFNFAAAAPGSGTPAPFQFTGALASDAPKPFVFGGGAPTTASTPGVFLFGASPAAAPTAQAPVVVAPPQAGNSAPAPVDGPLNFPLDPALRFSGLMEEDRPPPPPPPPLSAPAPGIDTAQGDSEPPPPATAAAAGEAPAPPSAESVTADAASAMDVDAEDAPLPTPSITSAAPEPNGAGDAAPDAADTHLARLAAPWLTVSGIAAPVLEAADHYWECRAVTVSCPTRPNWEAATICSLERTTRTGWCLQLAQASPLGVRAPVASRPFTPGLCYCNPLPGGCAATLCDESDSSGQASCVVVFNFGKAADCEAFVGFLSQRLDPFVIRSSLPPFQALKPPQSAASPNLPSPPAMPLALPSSPSPSPASPGAEAVPSPEFVLLTGPAGPEKSAWAGRHCPSAPGRTLLSVLKSDKATSWPEVMEQVAEKLREGQAVVVDVEDLAEEEARALLARLPPARRRVKHFGPPPPGVAELLQGGGFAAEL